MFTVTRSEYNPILSPNEDHPWEAAAAYNGCPVVIGKKTYLVYRALSEPQLLKEPRIRMSTIGRAISKDGKHYEDRVALVKPDMDFDKYGCEDPRVTKIGKSYYIVYTALGGFPFSADNIKVAVAISDDLETVREGGTGSYSEQEEQPAVLPDRYESGTLNSVGISGLGAGIKYVFAEGLQKIHAHGQGLRARIIESLSQMPGIKLYGTEGREGAKAVPIVSFNVEGYDAGEVGTILDQVFDIKVRTGLHCAPAVHKTIGTYPKGTVRLSAGYFNTEEEIDQALAAIKKIAAN